MLDLVLDRRRYLDRLSARPAWKRDLVDEFDDSRSTVDRAVDALEDADLIQRTEDGYETTYTGELLLETANEALAVAATATEWGEVINEFDTEGPREYRFFAGADVVTMSEFPPAVVWERVRAVVEESDQLRGGAFAPNDEEFMSAVHRRAVVEGSLDASLVVTEVVAEYLAAEMPTRTGDALDCGNITISVVTDLPFAWYIGTNEGRTRGYLTIHGAHDNFVGYAVNDDATAVEWLVSLFETHRDRGTPLAAYYRDAGTELTSR